MKRAWRRFQNRRWLRILPAPAVVALTDEDLERIARRVREINLRHNVRLGGLR